MLFGEYSVINNSMALAVPYEIFDGELHFQTDGQTLDSELAGFSEYLNAMSQVLPGFDAGAFEFDLRQGLIFESTIPRGQGMGSSGAVCAAIFYRYYRGRELALGELKKYFSIMESYFHGQSSGFDPLISYFKKPIFMNSEGKIEIINCPQYDQGAGGLFLINTGRTRRTEPLVNLFLEKLKISEFKKMCDTQLLTITNQAIIDYLEGNIDGLFQHFTQLSQIQLQHFDPMIPPLLRPLWKKGLEEKQFSLKLCGAGGGGIFLGITRDFKKLGEQIKNNPFRTIAHF
jgi:mevalonate kinase